MPTNLPPEYFEVEKRYKAASTPAEKVATLEELISSIPKHKGTDHLRANLRRRLSKIKSASQSKKGSSRQISAYHIDKEGAGQVVVIGPANVGKSSLVAALTNADPEVSAAPFTTWNPTPGMMLIENFQVQLIDTPPLNPDYVDPELINLIRRADLILLMVDLQTDPVQQLEDSLSILIEQRIIPRSLADRAPDTLLRLFFKPCLVLANKCDDEAGDEIYEIFLDLLEGDCPEILPISVGTDRNIEAMKQVIFERLDIIRVYSQSPGQEAKFDQPFVLPTDSTVGEFSRKVHKDFYDNLKSARIWGTSAAFAGQIVSREHVLQDGDVIELSM